MRLPMTDPSGEPRSTPLLIRIAVKSPDEEEAQAAVHALRLRGTREVLLAASRLCSSAHPRERIVGAEILGQLGGDHPVFPEERFEILEALVRSERDDPAVLGSACLSFGQLHDSRACRSLSYLRIHPSSDVRFGVACGLLGYSDLDAIGTLIELSADSDEEVRDWATFGLGTQIDLDLPEIRAALFARLDDPNLEVRAEALVGLARRKDPRALPVIVQRLQSPDLQLLDLEAAAQAGDSSLLALLRQIDLDPADEEGAQCLQDALRSCGGLLKSHSPSNNATGLQEKSTN